MAEMKEVGFVSCVVKPENLEKATEYFAKTYGGTIRQRPAGAPPPEPRPDMWTSQTVVIAGLNLQIMTPTAPGSILDRFLQKRGEGLYAIRFNVDDFEGTKKQMEEEGHQIVGYFPGHEFFIHPKEGFGIMMEIGGIIRR